MSRTLDLYRLLPAHIRAADEENGKALESLLAIISEQVDVVKRDTDRFYDDLFIETCSPWVVPYVGDLVSNTPLHDATVRARADVAKTIYYRRRKGTLPMLEEVARDVTGWPARGVAFFELLSWTQFLNHERRQPAPDPGPLLPKLPKLPAEAVLPLRNWHHTGASSRVGTVHLRDPESLDRIDGPFDEVAHTADVRAPGTQEGWHNIRNVGLFLWRLESYPITRGTARMEPTGTPRTRFRFSPLGRDMPLFAQGKPEMDEAEVSREEHVPGPIRPVALHLELKRVAEGGAAEATTWYGEDKVLRVRKGTTVYGPADVVCKDLAQWQGPPAGKVAIDPRLGRLQFNDAEPAASEEGVSVDYAYGFPADIGGGPYDRAECLANPDEDPEGGATRHLFVRKGASDPAQSLYPSVKDALQAWRAGAGPYAACVIEVQDNATYVETDLKVPPDPAPGDPPTTKAWTKGLVVQAADGKRPHLRLQDAAGKTADLVVRGNHPNASLRLNGLLVEGGLKLEGSLGRLSIDHCTLVPGRAFKPDGTPEDPDGASLHATSDNTVLRVEVTSSVTGQLLVAGAADELCVEDSIVHGPAGHAISARGLRAGPRLRVERSTILGRVNVRELSYASDAIFADRVLVERRQKGCVRFSYVHPDSTTPRRYRCQPDLATVDLKKEAARDAERARLVPIFTSRHYGDPGYCQLAERTAREIREGGEDGAEMGAYASLRQPQRLANLRLRLEEYLPFGLDAGFIFVT